MTYSEPVMEAARGEVERRRSHLRHSSSLQPVNQALATVLVLSLISISILKRETISISGSG
jgi:hypothetical protein